MHAMILEKPGTALQHHEVSTPSPGIGQVKVRVLACAVCRTDLHVVDGELPQPKLPLIPGHEIVGGYAEFALANAAFCFPLPDLYSAVEAAPLLCAGLIGYRSLTITGPAIEGKRLGIYGFGAAAHIIAQVAKYEGREVYAFTRPGKAEDQQFARSLGAVWAGGSDELPPQQLDAAIIFAPVGSLVPAALRALRKGGRVVCGGIHMSDIPSFPYSLLWEERSIHSVANLTRADATAFLALAPKVPVRTETETFPMSQANHALQRLRT